MPRKMTITFNECIQDSQDFGSDNDHMVSRVFFDAEVDGKNYRGLYSNLKQTVGSASTEGSIEVGPPNGYGGSFNHEAFVSAARTYFMGLVGPEASGIRIVGGGSVRMRNNRFVKKVSFTFDVA